MRKPPPFQIDKADPTRIDTLLSMVTWIIAGLLVAIVAFLSWRAFWQNSTRMRPSTVSTNSFETIEVSSLTSNALNSLPGLQLPTETSSIVRRSSLHTLIPNRPREEILDYLVQKGDSVFEIADRFNVTPETILWANYDLLNDNPDLISVGMELKIPPVDGVLYEWQEGDTLEEVSERFESSAADILNWPGNQLDLANPRFEPGILVLLPDGHREFRQWLIPTIPRGSAGVSKSVYGDGACEGSYDGALGTGTFIWPVDTHYLSGNDYWSGHLGIDIAAAQGAPVYASDGGVIVFSGWATGGYGYTVMIDHGNGYQTLYAHLSSVVAYCGQSVGQGATIARAGSTGNSTGTHLHFEVRYLGGFISPWFVLPAP